MKLKYDEGFFRVIFFIIALIYPLLKYYYDYMIPNLNDSFLVRCFVSLLLVLLCLNYIKKYDILEKRDLFTFLGISIFGLHYYYLLLLNNFNLILYSSFIFIFIFYAIINRNKFYLIVYNLFFLIITVIGLFSLDFISINKIYAVSVLVLVELISIFLSLISDYYIDSIESVKDYFYAIFNSNRDALLEVSYENGLFNYKSANIICKKIFDLEEEIIIDVNRLIDSVPLLHENIEKSIKKNETVLYETTINNRFFSVFIQRMVVKKEIFALINFRDVSKVKTYKERLVHSYFHDELTGLPNKTLFFDRLKLEIAHSKRGNRMVGIMYIDLTNFKSINEMTNYKVGDLVMKEVAKKMKFILRNSDTLARFGGDEFVLLFPDLVDKTDVSPILNKINRIFSSPFVFGDNNFFLNTSVGVSFYPNDSKDANELVKMADIAMIKAKESNESNGFKFYTNVMQDKTVERIIIENTLNSALSNNEFRIYYQPIINLINGEVYGVEALIRWNHPEFGMIVPDKFIYIAENLGLISNIDTWMTDQILSKIEYFQQLYGKKMKFSLNYSAFTFKKSQLLENLIESVKTYNIEPNSIIIELTETVIMLNEDILSIIKELKKNNFLIAIDDFGSGYSSLNYLNNITSDIVKLDKQFLDNFDYDKSSNQYKILNAITQMINQLDLLTIVEGVETKSQLSILHELNCKYGQGYLFSRPIPEDEFSEFLINVKKGIITFLD